MLTVENVLLLSENRINQYLEVLKGYAKTWNSEIELKHHDNAMNLVIDNYNHYSVTDSYHFENEETVENFLDAVFKIEEGILKINALQA